MAMAGVYLDALATHGASLITHIGLIDTASETIGAREAVTWDGPSTGNGTIRPDVDITFAVSGGATVAGWVGYSASAGGTNYGGSALSPETFNNPGEYKLLSDSTGIVHSTP